MIRLCLIGRGIAASPSPAMHRALLRACGADGVYEVQDTPPDQLDPLLARMRAGDYRGCNVTVPYKETVAARCDRLEGDAAILGAVNTLCVEDGALVGHTTDAAGFRRALERDAMAPEPGARSLVLGAGGAARAVCLALARLQAASITVVARRPERAQALAERLATLADVRVAAWRPDAVLPLLGGLDLAVNASPVGISSLPLHPRHLPPSCRVADVRYQPVPVDLVAAAGHAGLAACDGREMLVQQGVLSFVLWTGLDPPEPVARRAVNRVLG